MNVYEWMILVHWVKPEVISGESYLSNNFSYIKQQYFFFQTSPDKYHAATFLLCVQYLEMNED